MNEYTEAYTDAFLVGAGMTTIPGWIPEEQL